MFWEVLKDLIADIVKPNGRGEINGTNLQSTLFNMVNFLGEYGMSGDIAVPSTDPGDPDGIVFYFAIEAGEYTNFNNYIHNGKDTVMFTNSSGSWQGFRLTDVDSISRRADKFKSLPHSASPFNIDIDSSRVWFEESFPEIRVTGTKVIGSTYNISIVDRTASEITIEFNRHDGTSWIYTGNPAPIVITEGLDEDTLLKIYSGGDDYSIELLINPSKIPEGRITGNLECPIQDRCWNLANSYMQRISDLELLDVVPSLSLIPDSYLTETGTLTNSAFEIKDFVRLPKSGNLFLTATPGAGAYVVIQYYNKAKEITESIVADGTAYDNYKLAPTVAGAEYVRFSLTKITPFQLKASKDAYLSMLFDVDFDLKNSDGVFNEELTWREGEYLQTNGTLASSGVWATTELIQIDTFFYLIGDFIAGGVVAHYAFYDENESFISSQSGAVEYTAKYDKITPPSNTKYARLCTHFTEINTVQLYIPSESALHKVKEIAPLKIQDITKSANIIYGKYLVGLRDTGDSPAWNIIDFIEIKDDLKYYLTMDVQGGTYSVAVFYDINFKPITSIQRIDAQDSYKRYELTIPANTRYVKITISVANLDTFKFECDNESVAVQAHVSDINSSIAGLVMPKFIDMVEGHQCNIFLNNLTLQTQDYMHSDVIVQNYSPFVRKSRHLQLTPSAGQADFSPEFLHVDKKIKTLESAKPTFRTVAANVGSGEEVNIMLVGDSLTDNNSLATEVYRLLDLDGDYTFNQLGTRGPTGGKHEGRGSWAWNNYIEDASYAGKDNAFLYNGVLDFQQYCTDNSYSGIDYVIIFLGTNDVTQGNYELTQEREDEIISYAKTFLDALLSDYPNCKVSLGLSPTGAPIFTGGAEALFRYSILKLAKRYISEFDNGAYHANLTTSFHGAWMDVENSYPYTDEVVSDRISTISRTYTNSVHPEEIGYFQWADAYYAKIRSWLVGNL